MKNYLLPLCLFLYSISFAQEREDSLRLLEEVTVRAFELNSQKSVSGSFVKIVDRNNADRYIKSSLVAGFNTIPGVRMEERSPGSYRINIRGSSLRSPFGVRNVKVYWMGIPVTDPGGNTYFNQFAYNNFSHIEIYKGPASSLYGAGTGGLVLLENFDRWQPGVSVEYVAGSYGSQNILAALRFGKGFRSNDSLGGNRNQVSFAHNETDGYRVQSAMRRDNFSWISELKHNKKQQLTAALLFTDMYYQTPGGLTLAEYKADPSAARPAAGSFPSAVNAKAAIYQKNITAGLNNIYNFSQALSNSTILYGAFNQVKNPAIRNYERRNEPQFGARSFFTWKSLIGETNMKWIAGAELQQGWFNTQVAKNRNGNPDTLQTNDDINTSAYTFFIQTGLTLKDEWYLTAGASLNKTNIIFRRLSRYPVLKQRRDYDNEFAPRISLTKNIGDQFSVTGIVSKGFSPPTIAELLPSTGVISTELEAEHGWNYEAKMCYHLLRNRLVLEATGFIFHLEDALVQRRDLSGADYFINAGDIKQKGIELKADYVKGWNSSVFSYLVIDAGYTYNHFRYGTYIKGTENFSGNKVPSVPAGSLSGLIDLQLSNGIYVNATYYSASTIYVNDANTASADPYKLLGCRAGFKKSWKNKYRFNVYAGADNLLDEKYSLGNDINAAGGRFFNAAARANYYGGIALNF